MRELAGSSPALTEFLKGEKKMKTVVQELIKELETIQETKCKTLQERIFFDGVLAIIEGKYIEKEKGMLINFHTEVVKMGLIDKDERRWTDSYEPQIKEMATKYYNETFTELGTEPKEIE